MYECPLRTQSVGQPAALMSVVHQQRLNVNNSIVSGSEKQQLIYNPLKSVWYIDDSLEDESRLLLIYFTV